MSLFVCFFFLRNINENQYENSKMNVIIINIAHFLHISLSYYMIESDIFTILLPLLMLRFKI